MGVSRPWASGKRLCTRGFSLTGRHFAAPIDVEEAFIMPAERRKILVTGSSGQIGSELIAALRKRYGAHNVVASDIKPLREPSGIFELADATDRKALERIIRKHRVGSIYHFVSILSAAGEENPSLAWRVNIESLRNVLELAAEYKLDKVFWPSSIAAFGPHTPRIHTH